MGLYLTSYSIDIGTPIDRPTRQNAMRKGSACTLVYEAPAEDTNGQTKNFPDHVIMSPKQNLLSIPG